MLKRDKFTQQKHYSTRTECLEVEVALEKLKRNKSPGIDRIPAELIKTMRRTIRYEVYKLINSIWSKEELPEEWKE
jgi:hypothetical protein